MQLTAEELRVLACLIEKSFTTPDQYPLTTNALTAACNQKSNRDPVVNYASQRVDEVMQLLRDAGWGRSVRGSGSRSFKHKHVVGERLNVDDGEQALLGVLALRGPQSVGELKTRTERYGTFSSNAEVEQALTALASRPEPLVRNVGRRSGQSQDRWVQLIGDADDRVSPSSGSSSGDSSPEEDGYDGRPAPTIAPMVQQSVASKDGDVVRSGLEAFEQRLARLEARVDELEQLLD